MTLISCEASEGRILKTEAKVTSISSEVGGTGGGCPDGKEYKTLTKPVTIQMNGVNLLAMALLRNAMP